MSRGTGGVDKIECSDRLVPVMRPGDKVKQNFPPNDRERFGVVTSEPFKESGQVWVWVRFEESNVSYTVEVDYLTPLTKYKVVVD